MRRGSILHYVVGSSRLRVVVVSADGYNPARAIVAPLRERPSPELMPAYLVPIGGSDWRTPANIDLSMMRPMDPGAVAGQAGQLTHTALKTLSVAIRAYLGASP
jgi:hypothetical protein